MAVLRTLGTEEMNGISRRVQEMAEFIAETNNLECRISWTDEFPVTENSAEAVSTVLSAAGNLGLRIVQPDDPFPWSEDFGHFTKNYPGALFGLGTGDEAPALHSPEFDFPDELIPTGVKILIEIINILLNCSDYSMK